MSTTNSNNRYYDDHARSCEVIFEQVQGENWDGTPAKPKFFAHRRTPSGDFIDRLEQQGGNARIERTSAGNFLAFEIEGEYRVVGKVIN